MSMLTNTSSINGLLYPGAKSVGSDYYYWPTVHSQLFKTFMTDQVVVWEYQTKALSYAQLKTESGPTAYDSMQQMYQTSYEPQYFSLGFMITRKALKGNLYKAEFPQAQERLKNSMLQTKEVIAASVFNNATNARFIGGDGQPLLSNAHPTAAGTFSNILQGVQSALSQTSLQAALTQNRMFTDQTGFRVMGRPKTLMVPLGLEYTAAPLVGSQYTPDSPNNAINPIFKAFPKGVMVNPFLKNQNRWFIINEHSNGFKQYLFDPFDIDVYTDFETDSYKIKAIEAYAFGWSDPQCVFGSNII